MDFRIQERRHGSSTRTLTDISYPKHVCPKTMVPGVHWIIVIYYTNALLKEVSDRCQDIMQMGRSLCFPNLLHRQRQTSLDCKGAVVLRHHGIV
ncbi:hypothetical protein MTO96_035205 [Rhipicephalus appendiculatus]